MVYITPYCADAVEAQFTAATEILQLAQMIDHPMLIAGAFETRGTLFLLIGDVARAFENHAEYHRLRFEPRGAVSWIDPMRALLEGRFDDADRLARESLVTASRVDSPNAPAAYAMQLFQLMLDRGQLTELAEAGRAFASQYVGIPAWRCAVPAVHAELGQEREARSIFSELSAHGYADLPRDSGFLAGLSLLSETCAYLKDERAAAELYELLRPYSEYTVVVAQSVLCRGAVSQYLGLLAGTMRRWSDAEEHFQHALRLNAKLAARPAMTRTQHAYAAMLLERDEPGDRSRALDLIAAAIETARELGMKAVLERATALQRIAMAEGQPPEPPSPHASADGATVLRREGEYWTLTHAGSTYRMKDVKGLQYLAHLLRHPGQEFHALDLVRDLDLADPRYNGGERGEARSAKLEILDAPAKAAYRQRLGDLRAELEEAEQFNDRGRSEELRAEIEALTEQLAAAVGLGGRDREAASATERARSTVTQRLKKVIRKIGEGSPLLGDHLSSRVKTGTYCIYQPDPARPIVWQLD
jgi:tetratricopeptide (TPR) repeat protein